MKPESIRMSPRFVQTMMTFKDYLPKEKLSPPRNPNLIKIYGKQNMDREIIIGGANKASYIKFPRRKDSDERFLKLIDIDFQKQIQINAKIKNFNPAEMIEIRKTMHEQVIHSDKEQFQQIIRKNFSTHLTPEHYELMGSFRKEQPFSYKIKLKEPVDLAKSILNETVQRHEVYQQQLKHDKMFLDQPIKKFPQLNLSNLKNAQQASFVETHRSKSTKEFVQAINTQCLTERRQCKRILKQFKRAQGKFCDKFQGIQDECQVFLH